MMAAGTLRGRKLLPWILAGLAGVLLAAGVTVLPAALHSVAQRSAGPGAPKLRWAFDLGGQPAPDFTLVDQFGRRRSLSSFRGKEVALAFVDAQCTAVCPLTAEILHRAKQRLSPQQASRVALVAVNANPLTTSTRVTYRWSVEHRMLHRWTFLTGSPSRLRNVYARYRVFDVVTRQKQIEHDAAIILIDATGRERVYFNTAGSKQVPIVSSEETAYASGMARVLSDG